MHLVVAPVRPSDAPPPTAHHPLTVAKRPELSNVAEVAGVVRVRVNPNPNP